MKTRRDEVFLATKTLSRTYHGAKSDLEQSLKNLQTDKIDLWQMHSIRANENVDAIFSDTGCLKAFEEARDQGIIRFLGITGILLFIFPKKKLHSWVTNYLLQDLS